MPQPLDDRTARLQVDLLTWYEREARALPWRRAPDPWRILVSEVMLQQTQVARVEPVWRAFCARFPTPAALAAAPPGEALLLWKGLGYNRRAVALHRAARAVVEAHGGVVPSDLDALRALPGIGEYTARAILAFAHGKDTAPVDTNVGRVLVRAVTGAPLGRAALQRLADGLVPPGRASAWGQALMDLGAGVCTARRPRCEGCPLAPTCAWGPGRVRPDPASQGAARVRAQRPFAGSDREHRGRLVDALRTGPVEADGVARAAGLEHDPARAEAIAAALLADGLAERAGSRLRLPAIAKRPGPVAGGASTDLSGGTLRR